LSEQTALAARIQAELLVIENAVARAEHLMDKANRGGDDDYLDGVALSLHGFYSGVERAFESIAHDVDGAVPSTPEWHRDLLAQMAVAVSGARPAVIGRETWRCLDEYRGFRHIVRHIYAFQLRPARIRELGERVRACYESVNADLAQFRRFLEQE
jgi:hypothetical protein